MATVILVPPLNFSPAVIVPVIHSQHTTYLKDGTILPPPVPATVNLPSVGGSDPMLTAQRWYGCFYPTQIRDEFIYRNFWGRQDFLDRLDANIQGYVLVQSTPNADAWNLSFSSMEQLQNFNRTILTLSKSGEIKLDVTEATFNEINAWIKENITCLHEVHRGYSQSGGRISMTVQIKDLGEAAAFKLRWYNLPATMIQKP